MPAEYYEAPLLKETVHRPCLASQDPEELCIDLLYPPLPIAERTDAGKPHLFQEIDSDGNEKQLTDMSVEDLPESTGQAMLVQSDNSSKIVKIKLNVPEDGTYYVILEYFNLEAYNAPLKVQIEQGENTAAVGTVVINHCPYG